MNRKQILDDAANAVLRDRAATHGKPENSFGTIAKLWTIILGVEVKPHQVALCMDALKTARIMENPTHPDNWTDKAGYAACGGELANPDPVNGNHIDEDKIAQNPISPKKYIDYERINALAKERFGMGDATPNAAIVKFFDKYTGIHREALYENEEDISKRGRLPVVVAIHEPCSSYEEARLYGEQYINDRLLTNTV